MKLLAIMGPTASGKSALALRLAQQYNGEIVSIDSMQLYRDLPIGTAQPTIQERSLVPHHLIGIWELTERADVFTFIKMADMVISNIQSRNKIPILCGGTGMYFKALLSGLDDLPADLALRKQLDQEYDSDLKEDALHARLAELDPMALKKWYFCRRRLIRALEVKLITGKSILDLQAGKSLLRYDALCYRLDPPPEELKVRIRNRVEIMLQAGWIEEAEYVIKNGLFNTPTARQAIGYKIIAEYLNGQLEYSKLVDKLYTVTWQYARRQRTWFRHQPPQAKIITPELISKLCFLEISDKNN